jgi:hypothetical protein
MARKPKNGVLLVDIASGSQIGVIKFDPSGMLVYQIIQSGVPWFAFKPIEDLLSAEWMTMPLYKKHAELLDKNKKLPDDILVQEANSCADFLNSLANSLMLGGYIVKAQMVK